MNTPLLHVRDENELKLITNVMPEKVKDAKVVFGLTMDTQVALALAAQTQTPVTTTGLPLDVASKVGTVTVIRAWDKALPGGGRSTGCQPPKLMHTMEILDETAFKLLIESDLYRNAVNGTPAPTEEVF
jgi:hypothetical protein